jgi:hypothetical protein
VLQGTLRDMLSKKTVARRLKSSPYMERTYAATSPEEA